MNQQQYNGFDSEEFTLWIQSFLPYGRPYTNKEGQMLLVLPHFSGGHSSPDRKYLGNNLFISDNNGESFYQMHTGDLNGNSSQHTQSYEDPQTMKKYLLLYEYELYTRIENTHGDMERNLRNDLFCHFRRDNFFASKKTLFVPVPEVRVP